MTVYIRIRDKQQVAIVLKVVSLDSEFLLILAMDFQDESLDFSEEGLLTSWPDSFFWAEGVIPMKYSIILSMFKEWLFQKEAEKKPILFFRLSLI